MLCDCQVILERAHQTAIPAASLLSWDATRFPAWLRLCRARMALTKGQRHIAHESCFASCFTPPWLVCKIHLPCVTQLCPHSGCLQTDEGSEK